MSNNDVRREIIRQLTYEEYWKEICDKIIKFILKEKGQFEDFKNMYSKQYVDTDFNSKQIKDLYSAIENCCNILPDVQ